MECFGTTDFDNNSRLITLYAIIISGLHCILLCLTETYLLLSFNISHMFDSRIDRRSPQGAEEAVTSHIAFRGLLQWRARR